MWVPQQLDREPPLTLLPAVDPVLLTGLASVGEDVPSPEGTWYARVGWYPGGSSPFSDEKGPCEGRVGEGRLQSGCKVNT